MRSDEQLTEHSRKAFMEMQRRLRLAEQRVTKLPELLAHCRNLETENRKLEAENCKLRRRLDAGNAANDRRRRLLQFVRRAPLLWPAGRTVRAGSP
jgi:hypothetical protein